MLMLLALASMAGASAKFQRCIDRAGGVTVAVSDCQEAELRRADNRLNATYQTVMARLPPNRQVALRDEERLWISRRDQTCQSARQANAGGTAAGLGGQDCQLRESRQRTAELRQFR
jgi:uncharacterized protein YecT (DUF1311 family)